MTVVPPTLTLQMYYQTADTPLRELNTMLITKFRSTLGHIDEFQTGEQIVSGFKAKKVMMKALDGGVSTKRFYCWIIDGIRQFVCNPLIASSPCLTLS